MRVNVVVFVCLLVGVLWHINHCRLSNAKTIFIQINTSISKNSVYHRYTVQLSKTFPFQVIKFIQTVLIQPNQVSVSTVQYKKQFYFKQFSLS